MFHRVKSAPKNEATQVETAAAEQQELAEIVEETVETEQDEIVEEYEEETTEEEQEEMVEYEYEEEEVVETPAMNIPSAPAAYTAPQQQYQAYAPQPAQVDVAEEVADDDARLLIGRGINISGEIDACHTLVVEGTVEAALKGAKIVEVEETGVFYGAIEIEEATIAGRFEGEIVVNGRLTITSTGVVTGSISYKELEIEAGAIVEGSMMPIREGAQAQQPAPKTRKVKKKAVPSAQQPANELFPPQRAVGSAE